MFSYTISLLVIPAQSFSLNSPPIYTSVRLCLAALHKDKCKALRIATQMGANTTPGKKDTRRVTTILQGHDPHRKKRKGKRNGKKIKRTIE